MSGLRQIVLVANFLPDRQESMLRFDRALAEGFTARGFDVTVVRPEPRFVKLGPRYRYGGLPKYLGYLDKFVVFPRRLRHLAKTRPPGTVFHLTDHGNAVYAPPLLARPLLTSVHDLLQIRSARGEFPQNRLGRSGARYQEWILKNLRRVPKAACISRKTRDDLQRLAGLADAAMAVVPMSLNYPYRPLARAEAAPLLARALARHGLRWPAAPGSAAAVGARETDTPPFFFWIGGAQWYKNRTGLVAIFAALRRLPATAARLLVYAGPAFDAEQQAIVAQHGLQDAVIHLPALQNEELRAAYSLADGLIFPSWEEGFGWPVAEAQACGCPVFASNRAPMTEVGGEAAVYFDPADPAGAAATIAAALPSSAALRAAGLAYAARWEPHVMLDQFQELYAALVAQPQAAAASTVSAA